MNGKVSCLGKLKLSQVTNKKIKINRGGLFITSAQRSLESPLLLQTSTSIFQRSLKDVRRLKYQHLHTEWFWSVRVAVETWTQTLLGRFFWKATNKYTEHLTEQFLRLVKSCRKSTLIEWSHYDSKSYQMVSTPCYIVFFFDSSKLLLLIFNFVFTNFATPFLNKTLTDAYSTF